MKKIFSFITSLLVTLGVANAQTVVGSGVFENSYISVLGGGITTTHVLTTPTEDPFFWVGAAELTNGIRPYAGVEYGWYVTPVVGFSLEGIALFNTTGSDAFVNQSNVVANLKMNLSNWFGKYPGTPRRVEVVFVPGLGWGHDYGNVYHDRNYLTYNIGTELNINLGQSRAWQLNIKPVVIWNNYLNALRPMAKNLETRIQVGLTYKFKSRKTGSHNFVLCPYEVTKSDYEEAQNRIKELESRGPVVKEVVVEKEVVKEVIVEKPSSRHALSTVITFPIGSDQLTDVENAKLGVFGKVVESDEIVYITGSADSGTGSTERNAELALGRAKTVKDILVNNYGVAEDKIIIMIGLDTNENAEASRAAVLRLEVR